MHLAGALPQKPLHGSIRRTLTIVVSGLLGFSTLVSAETAPGPISNVPLITQGGAPPNLMMVLDSSGSMANLVSGTDDSRSTVMKSAASNLIDSLSNESMRVGIARFNGGNGARVLQNLTLLTDAEKLTLKTTINGIPASGVTPLAEAASDIGRYFTYGYDSDNNLVLHPANSYRQTEESASVASIFEDEPAYLNSISAPSTAVQYYCQKNFMLLLTDGRPNGDFDVSDDLKDYDLDCELDTDGDGVLDGVGDDTACRTYLDGDGSDYLDDVTTAMFDMDLRPDLTGPDSSSPVKNNVTSYMVGFAGSGLDGDSLLTAAAEQAGGKFFYASNSADLQTAFQSVLTDVFSKLGASSAASFNSTRLIPGTVVYTAGYNSGRWSGTLEARQLDIDGVPAEDAIWEASEELDNRSADSRLILTSEDGVGKNFTLSLIGGDTENPATPQEADLQVDTATATPDTRAGERLDYVRGDRSKEGSNADEFRIRDSKLGDIVNSTPIYVAAPPAGVYPDSSVFGADGNRYSEFVTEQEARTPVVYVGANDGMLHAFAADDGEELMAYIPELVLSTETDEGLHYLTAQSYAHRFYVDLTPTIASIFLDDQWRTVLVGGLGGGGNGYFFLDVTDPDSFSSTNAGSIVLDEIGQDDEDMGLSFSRPKVTLLNNQRWAAIFGNGYNSESGKALLYIYYFDNGDIKKIDTGWTGDEGDKNGLSSPSLVDLNGDGITDRVYAGDVQGNMWAFDLCNDSSGLWNCEESDANWDEAYGEPLFVTGTSSNREAITTEPRIAMNLDAPPLSGGSNPNPNLMILFGSGQYLNTEDFKDTDGTAFYGVWDAGESGLDSRDLASRTLNRVGQFRTVSGADIVWYNGISGEFGWTIPLQDGSASLESVTGGERVITESALYGPVIFFNTAIPSSETCSSGGTGFLMNVDFNTGLAFDEPILDGNGDGVIDDLDVGFVGVTAEEFVDQNEPPGGLPAEVGIPTGPSLIEKGDGSIQLCLNVAGTAVCGDRDGFRQLEGRLSWLEITPF